MKVGVFIFNNDIFNDLVKIKENNFNPNNGGLKNDSLDLDFLNLYFLTKLASIKDSNILIKMLELTLTNLYKSKSFDHVGYGFFNGFLDFDHLIPNFEKSLYTNASAILAYSNLFKLTKDNSYKDISYNIISYINTNLSFDDSFYYSSQFSNKEDYINFYSFSYGELLSILGEDATIFSIYYDLTKEGNFNGKNLLNLQDRDIELNGFFDNKIHLIRENLLKYKNNKYKLSIDKKISISSNALAIASLSYAGASFKDKDLINKGKNIIDFILSNFYKENILLLPNLNSENKRASLNDYVFFIFALIEYYKASKDRDYLDIATKLSNYVAENFYNSLTNKNGIIFDSKDTTVDSIMILNLLSISHLTDSNNYLKIIEETLSYFYPNMIKNPNIYPIMVFNLLYYNNINI